PPGRRGDRRGRVGPDRGDQQHLRGGADLGRTAPGGAAAVVHRTSVRELDPHKRRAAGHGLPVAGLPHPHGGGARRAAAHLRRRPALGRPGLRGPGHRDRRTRDAGPPAGQRAQLRRPVRPALRRPRADAGRAGGPPSGGAAAAARRPPARRRRRPGRGGAGPVAGPHHVAGGRGRRPAMTMRPGTRRPDRAQSGGHPDPEAAMRHAIAPASLALAIALSLGLAGCGQTAAPDAPAAAAPAPATAEERAAETARLNAWFEEQFEEQLRFSPIRLTFLGRKELYDQIDDASEEGMRRQLAWLEASVREMEADFDYDRLEPEAQLSWQLWKKQYEQMRDGMAFIANNYP